jgi:hypothetical protein
VPGMNFLSIRVGGIEPRTRDRTADALADQVQFVQFEQQEFVTLLGSVRLAAYHPQLPRVDRDR